ncbi:MAG: hypothetical protein M3P94_01470 [Chloroflexota bacterium]|nr:hypothetical protein [Chloroflexota bacterium]
MPPTTADIDAFRATTDRARILAEFLGRPIAAIGGGEEDQVDPDVIAADNLARAQALRFIRAAAGSDGR